MVDGDRGSSHVLLPSVAPRLATAPCVFLASESPSDLSPGGGNVYVDNSAVGSFRSDPLQKKKQKISNWQRRSNNLEYVLDALGENTGRKTLRYFVVPRNSFFDAFSFQNVDDGGETLVVN